jgi:hypothetical protein
MGRLSSSPVTVPVIDFCCAAAGNKIPENRNNKNRSFLITFILGLVIEQMGLNESFLMLVIQINVRKQIYNLLI